MRAIRHLSMISALTMAACAHVPNEPEARAEYERSNDPAEPTNRAIFAGNQYFDRNALQPVARTYQAYVPSRARRSIHNFVSNLGEPQVAVNDILQGNLSRAWTTARRFAVNTTVGGAGLFDAATDWNLPHHQADFGQTLGVWGVGPGPAVQLPLLGPSNVRDSAGAVAGFVANPLNFVPGGAVTAVTSTGAGLGVVDGRAGTLGTTDDLQRNSLDYYAALRSAVAQRRAALVEEARIGMARPPASATSGSP